MISSEKTKTKEETKHIEIVDWKISKDLIWRYHQRRLFDDRTGNPKPSSFPPFMLRLCDPKTSGPSIRLTLFPPSTIRLEPPARHSKIRILNSLASILLWALCAGLLCFSDCDWTLASLTFPDRQRTHFFPADLVAHPDPDPGPDQTINLTPNYNTAHSTQHHNHTQGSSGSGSGNF